MNEQLLENKINEHFKKHKISKFLKFLLITDNKKIKVDAQSGEVPVCISTNKDFFDEAFLFFIVNIKTGEFKFKSIDFSDRPLTIKFNREVFIDEGFRDKMNQIYSLALKVQSSNLLK